MVRLLTPEELAEYLGISVHTIYQMTSKRRIPYIKVGRLIRFSESEIQQWLDINKLESESKLVKKVLTHGKNLSTR